mmetsp:Transcript_142359/g.354777  ORF Transcript_142359/g.354777 Transcript_142359/m.354777 type:complete len:210 (+) Transcript_142359:180-809(+)
MGSSVMVASVESWMKARKSSSMACRSANLHSMEYRLAAVPSGKASRSAPSASMSPSLLGCPGTDGAATGMPRAHEALASPAPAIPPPQPPEAAAPAFCSGTCGGAFGSAAAAAAAAEGICRCGTADCQLRRAWLPPPVTARRTVPFSPPFLPPPFSPPPGSASAPFLPPPPGRGSAPLLPPPPPPFFPPPPPPLPESASRSSSSIRRSS